MNKQVPKKNLCFSLEQWFEFDLNAILGEKLPNPDFDLTKTSIKCTILAKSNSKIRQIFKSNHDKKVLHEYIS